MGHVFYMRRGRTHTAPSIADPNTILLIHGDQIMDSSIYRIPLTNSGVTVSTTQSKFGGKSLYFNGNAKISCNLSSTKDMTVDCWIYIDPTVQVEWPTPFCYGENERDAVYYHAERNVTTCREEYNGATTTANAPAIPRGKWVHTAVVRSGSSIMFFIDGKLQATIKNSQIGEFKTLSIGSFIRQDSGTYFKGHIDEFCVSRIARWKNNFTPPTAPYSG